MRRRSIALVVMALVIGACSGEGDSAPTTGAPTTTTAPVTTQAPTTTVPVTTTTAPDPIDALFEVVTPPGDGTVVLTIDGETHELTRTHDLVASGTVTAVPGTTYEATDLATGATTSGIVADRNHVFIPMDGNGREFGGGFVLYGCHYCPVSYTRGDFLDSANEAYDEMIEAGAEWVNLIPVWFVTDIHSSDLRPIYREEYGLDGRSGWQHATITDDELTTLIDEAHARGLAVYLSPHIATADWGPDVPGKGDLAPVDVEAFTASFQAMTRHYASIAQDHGVELYSIGNELATLSDLNNPKNPGFTTDHWYRVIDAAKEVYDGPVTYSESCHSTDWCLPEHIRFWDALDVIGFEWYIPVAGDDLASVVEGARDVVQDRIVPLSQRWGKPVVITEIGFEAKPNSWNRTYEGGGDGGADKLAAVIAYEAFFQAIAETDVVEGMHIWTWHMGTREQHTDGDGVLWIDTYNGNEVRFSIIQAQISKWFAYFG